MLLSIPAFSQKKDVGFLLAQELFEAKKYYEALYEFQSVKTYDQGEEDFKNKYIAKIYAILENSKEASPYLSKLNSDDKDLLIGKNFLKTHQTDSAIFYLENAVNVQQINAEASYFLGNAYFEKNDFEKAYQNFSTAKSNGFVTDNLNKKIGVCAYFYGNFLEAAVALEDAKTTLGSDIQLNNYLGMSYFNIARKDLAIETLRNTIYKNPNEISIAELAVNLSLIFDDLRENDSAVFYLKKALEIDPNRVDALYFLGNKFYDLKMYKQSQYYFEKLLNINPNYEKAYKQLANAYYLDNVYDKAIEKYRQSTFFDKKPAEELNFIGVCYLQNNDLVKAKSYFEEALKVDATFFQAYMNLANLSFQENLFDDAISYLSYANQYKKNNPDVNFLFAKVYLQTEKLADAEYYFKETIRFDPLKKKAYLYLGYLALLKENFNEANFYYDILLTFEPLNFEGNLYRGISSYLNKDNVAAITYLLKAKNIDPKDYQTRYQLAKAYLENKDYMESYILLNALNIENPTDIRINYLLQKTCKALGIKDEAKQNKDVVKAFEKVK